MCFSEKRCEHFIKQSAKKALEIFPGQGIFCLCIYLLAVVLALLTFEAFCEEGPFGENLKRKKKLGDFCQ